MIKKKLSRIEDFISPTCFSYQANLFRYSYKFPSTPTLYKTKHDSSFYFLNFIIRTKLLVANAIVANAIVANATRQTMPCYARQANEVVVLPRWCTSEVNAYISNASLRESLLRKPSLCESLRSKPSETNNEERRFAKQTFAGASRYLAKRGTRFKLRALYTRYLIHRTREGSLTTFGKIRSQKITTIFFNSTDTTSYIIIRPLINCSRKSISIICRLTRLPVYPDLSNLKLRYSRNRIRKQIIPTLKFFLNPKIEKSLFKFSENLE